MSNNESMFKQSQLNIGTLGHVDHGKTTLTRAITGVWTDKHSESIKRSMTIKLGYADAFIKKCSGCKEPEAYTVGDACEGCNGKPEIARRISILDAPGHETLMATAIAGSNIIDAVLFVISASEPCPMPQTKEHLMLINALGIKNVIIVQTKIDIVGKEASKAHYQQIKNFVKGSVAENAPIIPVIASKNINIDALLQQIMDIPVPERDTSSEPLMYIARSFDINKPGAKIKDLVGGVIGGSVIRGTFKLGDEIEIRPGVPKSSDKSKKVVYEPLITEIRSLSTGTSSGELEQVIAGGLVAIGTSLDPSLTKADNLVGSVVGHVGKLPDMLDEIAVNYVEIQRNDIPKQSLRVDEPLILSVGTATTIGYVKSVKKKKVEIELKRPLCIDTSAKISIMRNFSQRWRLCGYATLIQ
ncbi:MAG: translation initiation factor IF-2 subunit gamma [Candidatus Micrarchaeia archaeon]